MYITTISTVPLSFLLILVVQFSTSYMKTMHVTGLYFPTEIGCTPHSPKVTSTSTPISGDDFTLALLGGSAGLFAKLGFYFALGCELLSRFQNMHGRASLARVEAESDDTLKKRL